MSSYSRQQLESWLKTIDVKANDVLDIGGSQNPIKGRTKSWEVNEYKILDLEQPHELKQKPDIVCDLNNFAWIIKEKIEYKSDVVFCIEVAEYWWRPFIALTRINSFMKKGGILYLSFHFVYPVHNPKEDDCLRYTELGAVKLLSKAGFEVKDIKYRTTQNANIQAFYGAEQMRPAKNYSKHNITGILVTAKKT